MKTKTHNYPVTPLVQKTLVILGALAYIPVAAMSAYMLAKVYSSGPRLSPFLIVSVESILTPLILFGIAYYFMRRGKARRLWRSFESVLLVLMAVILGMSIGSIFTAIPAATGSLSSAALYQLVPGILMLAGYILLLVWYGRLQHPKDSLPAPLQKLFIFLGATAYVLGFATVLFSILRQYPNNQNLSGFYPILVSLAIPVVLFALAYLMAAKKLPRLNRIFEAALFTLMGLLLFSIISQAAYLAPQWLLASASQHTAWYWRIIEISIAAITIAIYSTALWIHRRQRA